MFTLPREEVNIATLVDFLYKHAGPPVLPESPEIWRLEVALVMHAHHSSNRPRGFDGVIEWDARGMVVQHMRLDGAVKENPTDKAKVTIYSGCRATKKSPCPGWVVWNGEVRML